MNYERGYKVNYFFSSNSVMVFSFLVVDRFIKIYLIVMVNV